MADLIVRENPGGGEFGSLSAALSAANPNDTIRIQGAWTANDTTDCVVSDDNLTIVAEGAARHPGWDDPTGTFHRLRSMGGAHAITVNATGCDIDGMCIGQGQTGSSDEGIRINNGVTSLSVSNTVFVGLVGANQQDALYSAGGSPALTVNLENIKAYNWGRAAINAENEFANRTQTWNINCFTAYNCGTRGAASAAGGFSGRAGSSSPTNWNIFNSISMNHANGPDYNPYSQPAFNVWDVHDSIDSDGTITTVDTGAVGAIQNRTATDNGTPGAGDWVIFNDITTNTDLRLQDNVTDNDAQEAHSKTSGTAVPLNMPATDIAGSTRAAPYDVGAFENVGAGPVIPLLEAAVAGAAALVGTLQRSALLLAGVAGAATANATLLTDKPLAGGLTGQATVTATLQGGAPSAELQGDLTGAASVQATLLLPDALAGSLVGTAEITKATLTPIKGFQADVAGAASIQGTLQLPDQLVGSLVGSSSITGDLAGTIIPQLQGSLVGSSFAVLRAPSLLKPRFAATMDLSPFFQESEFAYSMDYNNGQETIVAIWEDFYGEIIGGMVNLAGSDPWVKADHSLIPQVKEGDTFAILEFSWTVREVQPSNTGIVRLKLESND